MTTRKPAATDEPTTEPTTEPALAQPARELTAMTAREIEAEYREVIGRVQSAPADVTLAIVRRCTALSAAIAEIRTLRETLGL